MKPGRKELSIHKPLSTTIHVPGNDEILLALDELKFIDGERRCATVKCLVECM